MSMIWHWTICWQSDLLLLHLCSTSWIVFFCHYGALNLKYADPGTTPFTNTVRFPNPFFSPFTCHKTQTLHQWFSAMCQWDPRVAGFHSNEPLKWLFHWLVSILWLNMCKPVKSVDGETAKKNPKKQHSWAPTACGGKLTALQKAGVTENIKEKTLWLYWEEFPADACYK